MKNVNIEQVRSVYSGKNGRCCCGCAGKHTFSSKHRAWASKDRGYSITDDEVNDRVVRTIVNRINRVPRKDLEVGPASGTCNFVSFVDYSKSASGRLYIAYLKTY